MNNKKRKKAIFFDRDGVLIEDSHLLISKDDIIFADDLIETFQILNNTEYSFFIITNQTVIARGLANEDTVENINNYIIEEIAKKTNCNITKAYYCPHHQNATLEEYRIDCECRKPKPGMLLRASLECDIDLSQSYMIGDRISDIVAGNKAGCKTVLLETGAHLAKPIESDAMDLSVKADYICPKLKGAIKWIIKK